MEGLQKVIRNVTKDSNLGSSSSFETPRLSEGLPAALSSSDQSHVLVARSSRYPLLNSQYSLLFLLLFHNFPSIFTR